MSTIGLRKPHVRKLGALVTSLVASSALIGASALAWAPGASATPLPGSYGGSSAGQSFYLAVAGQQLSAGLSTAKIDSNNNASAEGTGSIIITQKFGDQTASVSAKGKSQTLPVTCATPTIPPPLNFIQLNLSCGSADAAVSATGLATSDSSGYVSNNSTVNLQSLLANIPGVGPAVGGVFTQLGTALNPILSQLPGGLGTTVTTLLNRLPATTTVGIDIGKSTSSEVATATTVTSEATTTGIQIRILPILNGPALATVTVAPASATATLDRTTGKATGATTAAIVRIQIPTLSIDQTISTPSAPPITVPGILSVSLENSNITNNPDGSVTASAGAVDVEVLPGLAGGVPGTAPGGISNSASLLSLKLAQVTASVGGAALGGPTTPTKNPGGITPINTPAPVSTGTLPFTGEQPWIPLAGAGLLGMSAIGLAVRRFGLKPWRS